MENTDHISTDLPSVDTLEAVRRNHAQRLLDIAEAMLQAFEAIDIPKDAPGLDRVGKALLTLNKVMDTLHQNARDLASKAEQRQNNSDLPGRAVPDPAETLERVKIYRAAQGLRLEAMALKRGANGQGEGDGPATKPPPPRHRWP